MVANHDRCGRCGVRHGGRGNDHLCPVHGAVAAGCCDPRCDPAAWVWIPGIGSIRVEDKWVWVPGTGPVRSK